MNLSWINKTTLGLKWIFNNSIILSTFFFLDVHTVPNLSRGNHMDLLIRFKKKNPKITKALTPGLELRERRVGPQCRGQWWDLQIMPLRTLCTPSAHSCSSRGLVHRQPGGPRPFPAGHTVIGPTTISPAKWPNSTTEARRCQSSKPQEGLSQAGFFFFPHFFF